VVKSKKKDKSVYACASCGTTAAQWLGRCPGCGEWNTMAEEVTVMARSGKGGRSGRSAAVPVPLSDVRSEDAERMPTGIGELDRVLGGGLVRGGVTLLGGDPGIGKSTLLMQALAALSAKGLVVIYATGEESASQVALRGERIGGEGMDKVQILATTELEDVERALGEAKPHVAVVDSIQTVRSRDVDSSAGSVSQLREVSARLIDVAKRDGMALFLIGHVTKDGALAGPKMLEHLVDTVLAFEGDQSHAFRILRGTKNRFGPTHEMGVFEMVNEGLIEVPDPSALFLAERPTASAGSLVVPTAEGSRPLLVEVQALVAPAVSGAARRVATGVDSNRLAILLAVIERKADVHVLDRDVFVSVAGGARVEERAMDLGLALAVVSSLRERAVDARVAAFGEVGLAGELRAVPRPGPRVSESVKMGFTRVVLPKANAERLTPSEREGAELVIVGTLAEAIEAVF
jgi:DNA repair protein RadA/Sms